MGEIQRGEIRTHILSLFLSHLPLDISVFSVGFEKPLATSEIDSGEKNAEKRGRTLFTFFGVLVHT